MNPWRLSREGVDTVEKGFSGVVPSSRARKGFLKTSPERKLDSMCALQGTRFYPPTISSVARSTFSTVSFKGCPRDYVSRASASPPIPDGIAAAQRTEQEGQNPPSNGRSGKCISRVRLVAKQENW